MISKPPDLFDVSRALATTGEPKRPRRYLGIFLDGESRGKLLRAVPPRHPNIFAEHVTVLYDPTDEQINAMRNVLGGDARLHLGPRFEIFDERGQCVVLDQDRPTFPVGLRNRVPHITVSTAEYIEPAYSNILMEYPSLRDHQSDKFNLGRELTLRGDMRLCTSTTEVTKLF